MSQVNRSRLFPRTSRRLPSRALAVLCAGLLHACSGPGSGSGSDPDPPERDPALSVYRDPGTGEWETVARDRLVEECGLDPDILDEIDAGATHSYAIVRHGKLCHEFYHPDNPGPDELAPNWSATKTLGAVAVGRAVKMSAGLPMPLSDTDRVDAWIGDISFNPDALVAHVLAMVAFNESLDYGQRTFSYDAAGNREINRLVDVVEAVLAQNPAHFGGAETLGDFARREILDPLGMNTSIWPGESIAISWNSNLRDMARLGLLLIHDGVWDGQRLLDPEWVFKMTHPSFEDATTGYGYLTWLTDGSFSTCEPYPLWPEYPHPISESPDCGSDGRYACMQVYDSGTFGAAGSGGQLIVGHRGLDLVIVTRDAGQLTFIQDPWNLVRRALIAHDPMYAGNEEAFCDAYAAGDYAPDIITVDE